MSELTQALAPAIKKPWHEAIMDLWIADPTLTQGQIARMLGKTEGWVSIVVNSDAFRARMKERKGELVDPSLQATVEDRLRGVAARGLDLLLKRLDTAELTPGSMSTRDLLGAVRVSTHALGMAPTSATPPIQQNLYVLPAPAVAQSPTAWAERVQQQLPGAGS